MRRVTRHNVYGATGHGTADTATWLVGSFACKGIADELCEKLNQWLLEHNYHRDNNPGYEPNHTPCPLDPSLSVDFHGTDYAVFEEVIWT